MTSPRFDRRPHVPNLGEKSCCRRGFAGGETLDVAFAGGLIGALSPVLAARAAAAALTKGRVFDRHRRLGRGGRPITIPSFAGDLPGRRLAYLFSLAAGDLRVFGPRPLHPRDGDVRTRPHDVTPGLLSPQRLRARTGIDYAETEQPFDPRPVRIENLALAARYLVAETLRGGTHHTPPVLRILGIDVQNTTMQDALDRVMADARTRPMTLVAFVNPDCLNKAVTNPAYRALLRRADAVFPDGIGVKIAAGFQHADIRENVNGTDMFPRMCERAVEEGLSLYLLGGRPGVAEAVAERMIAEHPGLTIAGTHHGYFDRDTEEEDVVRAVRESGADILLVAFGVPRQEFWLDAHRADLGVGVGMGVGGLFDFYSGRIPRAPQWVREMGFEWVWRLAQEPGRMWRRYVVGNPLFLLRAWRDAAQGQADPSRASRRKGRPPLLGYGYYGS